MDLLCQLIDAKKNPPRHPMCNTALEKMGLFSLWEWSCLVFLEWCSFIGVLSVCAAHSSSMCSTQPDRNSLKLQLHCGYQFQRCALTLKVALHVRVNFRESYQEHPVMMFRNVSKFWLAGSLRSLLRTPELRELSEYEVYVYTWE